MPADAFAVRLADLLATLESAALFGAAERRVRGLGAALQLACAALPCDEALVAVEIERLGRLRVPGVAGGEGWRPLDLELLPSGTPFAFLMAGGGGYAAELAAADPLMAAIGSALRSRPRYGLFTPIRLGAEVIGGTAFLRENERLGDRELGMGEQLAEVLSGALEAFRTERALIELFAAALPDLCAADGETGFSRGLGRYLHGLRVSPDYRRKIELARAVSRLCDQGGAEAELAADVIAQVERYLERLTSGQDQAARAG